MSEYDHYVAYRNATDQIRERVESKQRSRSPGQRRRHPTRHALARRLRSIAEVIDG